MIAGGMVIATGLPLGCTNPAGAQNVTPTTLARALANGRSGGRLTLAPGNYGPLRIAGIRSARPLVIESAVAARPATFSKIDIVESADVRLATLKVAFTPTMATTTGDSAVSVYRSSQITLRGLTVSGGPAINGVPASTPEGQLDRTMNIRGQPTARGITVHKSNGVTVDQSEVTFFSAASCCWIQRSSALPEIPSITSARHRWSAAS